MNANSVNPSTGTVRRFLPGGMSVDIFLRDYWQKKPLLIRDAMPGFGNDLDKDGLLKLAARDDVESRFVAHDGTTWELAHGPFPLSRWKRRKGPWTVLVQGVNQYLPAGTSLLQEFNFIPHARLDDLMVSFATDGGGVGPHIDNYDVFLLQGHGQRRWRIGKPHDRSLVEDAALRILRNFEPDEELLLNPGDMLYLPPDWAHDGVAVGECMTWSIGFRTTPTDELVDQFMLHLQDELRDAGKLEGRYADPDLIMQKHPGEIAPDMVARVSQMLRSISWDDVSVKRFLGRTLSEPKSNVVFETPQRPLSLPAFSAAIARRGVTLDLKSRLLFEGADFYINGDLWQVPRSARTALKRLADFRQLSAAACAGNDDLAEALHEVYCVGYLGLGN